MKISPVAINAILGTLDVPSSLFTEHHIRLPYQPIRHTLVGPTSIAKWIRHSYRGYYHAFLFSHMNRETRVWTKIIMYSFIPGLYYTEITQDKVCLVYALMTGAVVNIRVVFKSSMRKARVHKGHRYAFRSLITKCVGV